MAALHVRYFLMIVCVCSVFPVEAPADESLRDAVTFYASFDEDIAGDIGGGVLDVSTRSDDPDRRGQYIIKPGYPEKAFRIALGGGKLGGALEALAVLPNRGRLFFPAKGNIAFRSTAWDGTVSFWLRTNPDTMLQSRFCDPIQITQKRAHDGALWIDFPDTKPRDLRLGAFTALTQGEAGLKESDPLAPLIHVKKIGFQEHDWHHLVMSWRNVDSGKADSRITLWIDGRRIGELRDRNVAMKWDVEKTGIYFAVGLIGWMDELAVFRRTLTDAEITALHSDPGLVHRLTRK